MLLTRHNNFINRTQQQVNTTNHQNKSRRKCFLSLVTRSKSRDKNEMQRSIELDANASIDRFNSNFGSETCI